MDRVVLLFLIFLLFSFYYKFNLQFKFKNINELFSPIEDNSKYNQINNKFCLLKKEITENGGKYTTKLSEGKLPKLYSNEQIRYIDEYFTENDCLLGNIGSGRIMGGFECMDFLTKKMAKKYNMDYSDKTCYDNLPYSIDSEILNI